MLIKKLQRNLLICLLTGCFVIPSTISVDAARSGPHNSIIGNTENTHDEPLGANIYRKEALSYYCSQYPATSANHPTGQNYARTPGRIKYTDSSIYVWIKKMSNSYCTASTSQNKIRVSTENRGYKNSFYSGADTIANSIYLDYDRKYRYLHISTEYLVYNYVFEQAALHLKNYGKDGSNIHAAYDEISGGHYTYASLNFKFSTTDENNKIYGLWSPDSIPTSSTVSTWGSDY